MGCALVWQSETTRRSLAADVRRPVCWPRLQDPDVLLRSLSDLKQRFSVGSLMRGERYFLEKRVRLERIDDDCVEAVVRGTHPYRVNLRPEKRGPGLAASCTCRGYFDTGICKHIWATMLAVRGGHSRRRKAARGSGRAISARASGSCFRRVAATPRRAARAGRQSRVRERSERPAPPELRPLGARGRGVEECHRRGAVAAQVQARRMVAASRLRPARLRRPRDAPRGRSQVPRAVARRSRRMWAYGRGSRYEVPPELQPILLPRIAQGIATLPAPLRRRTRDRAGRGRRGPLGLRGRPRPKESRGQHGAGGDPRAQGRAPGPRRRRQSSFPAGCFAARERLSEVDWHGAWGVAQVLRQSGRIEVPSAREGELLTILCALPGESCSKRPTSCAASLERPRHGSSSRNRRRRAARARRSWDGSSSSTGLSGRAAAPAVAAGGRRSRCESLAIGRPSARRSSGSPPSEVGALQRTRTMTSRSAPSDLPELVRALTAEGWQVEAEGRLLPDLGFPAPLGAVRDRLVRPRGRGRLRRGARRACPSSCARCAPARASCDSPTAATACSRRNGSPAGASRASRRSTRTRCASRRARLGCSTP